MISLLTQHYHQPILKRFRINCLTLIINLRNSGFQESLFADVWLENSWGKNMASCKKSNVSFQLLKSNRGSITISWATQLRWRRQCCLSWKKRIGVTSFSNQVTEPFRKKWLQVWTWRSLLNTFRNKFWNMLQGEKMSLSMTFWTKLIIRLMS